MTDKERYYKAVDAYFTYLYKYTYNHCMAEAIERIRLAGYNVSDCACALFRGLEHEAREAEKMGEG